MFVLNYINVMCACVRGCVCVCVCVCVYCEILLILSNLVSEK